MIAVSPALPHDIAAIHPVLPRAVWRALLMQILRGKAWSAWDGESGAIVAVFGLWPLEGDAVDAEAWFSAGPACRQHLPAFVRQARLTLESSPYRAVGVKAASAAGARLAGLVGFEPIPTTGGVIAMVWERHGSDRGAGRDFSEPAAEPGDPATAAGC